MTCNTGSMTVEEGARAPVMLALSPDDGPSELMLVRFLAFYFFWVDGLSVYVVKSMITSEERGSFCFNLFDFYCSLFGC